MYFEDMLMWGAIGVALLIGGLLIVWLSRRVLTLSERVNAGIGDSLTQPYKSLSNRTKTMQAWYIIGWVIAALGSITLAYQVIFPLLALGVLSALAEILR